MRLTRFCLILAFASGCGSPYQDALEANTPEAWEAYLAQAPPTDGYRRQAEANLEKLLWEGAREAGTLEAWDAFLARYPEGNGSQYWERVREDFEIALRREADRAGSADLWKRYLAEFPKAGKKRKTEARNRILVAEHLSAFTLGPIRQERVNLAEDPEGPPNGWGWWVEVRNAGQRPIDRLSLALTFLDDEDRVLDRRDWPVVAQYYPGRIPVQEGFDRPIRPGETRTWEYTDGDIPEGWSGRVRVYPVYLRFLGDAADSNGERDEGGE
ncbi:MAG: hypothetical protein JXB39_00625 [Deltaproteobacteria bacterium]|nr:hypothetical protein [Deltaproteobacteria bacterium]